MSKCKPTQDATKIFTLDILCELEDGEVEVRSIEPVGNSDTITQSKTASKSA